MTSVNIKDDGGAESGGQAWLHISVFYLIIICVPVNERVPSSGRCVCAQLRDES